MAKPKRDRGLNYVIGQLEQEGVITQEDINVFMGDLNLPKMRKADMERKMKASGASITGFERLNEFFVFLVKELWWCEEETAIQAFEVFDGRCTGFIEVKELKRNISSIGHNVVMGKSSLNSEEIDEFLRVSDIDGDVTINYGEIVKRFLDNENDFMNTITK